MKGTIYLWVLAAVLSGALAGLLGFVVEGVFSLQSSFMEPVIIGAIAGAWRYSLRSRSSETGKQTSRSEFCLELRPTFQPPSPLASHSACSTWAKTDLTPSIFLPWEGRSEPCGVCL